MGIGGTTGPESGRMDLAETAGIDRTRGDETFRLRILATSDLHAHILPYDYASDRPAPGGGLAAVARRIREARAEVPNSLTFDNGDFLEGSPLGELLATDGVIAPGAVHPVIAAMNAVGYDAVGLGNHEFSYGVAFLERALAAATFPVLSANALRDGGATGARPFLPQTLILTRTLTGRHGASAPLRIGLFSVMPPQVTIWERKHLQGQILAADILQTARHCTTALRREGADIIIALCHSGIGEADPSEGAENAAVPLAAIEGVDVVIAGHTHESFPGPDVPPGPMIDPVAGTLHGKPAVKAGYGGSHCGIIDLILTRRNRQWSLLRATSRAEPTALAAGDPAVAAAVARDHARAVDFVRTPIGRTGIALHSHFARVGPSTVTDLVHAAQLGWLRAALQGTAFADLPQLSATSPLRAGGRNGPDHYTDIPPGTLRIRHIHDLYPFPNSICALLVTGRSIRNWLERAAAQFLTLQPGLQDQPLIDPEVPAYNFDTIAGLSYAFDLTVPVGPDPSARPERGRVRDLQHAGRPVTDEMRFALVTQNFRASGGGRFLTGDEAVIAEPGTLVTEILGDHIRAGRPPRPAPATDWRILNPGPGTSAWFDTGPRAQAYPAEAAALGITACQPLPNGFLRCHIRF